MLHAYGTEGHGLCFSDKRATSLMTLAEFRKDNLLICRGAIYTQKEQPKTRQIHLAQQNRPTHVTQLLQLQQQLLSQYVRHRNYIVRLPIHRLSGRELGSSTIYTNQ
ncbi:hypothetical protein TNCV_2276591 [Trichonephila clavipes]|nr:hypothetical protein TNCV_2276591 [Trichonephila clavipes]